MIVKRNFTLPRILPYVWRELVFVTAVAVGVWFVGLSAAATLPFAPVGVVGTVLGIVLAIRTNIAYARWWEARTIWSQIVTSSRIVARLIVAAADNARKLGKGGTTDELAGYTREMIYRQIAFAHALRMQLRGQSRDAALATLAPLLPVSELEQLRVATNLPNLVLQTQGARLKDGVREERVGAFDPISLEPALGALNAAQSNCERIKATPFLRAYDFFTRVFLWTFLAILPASLAGLFVTPRWIMIPVAILIGFVYAITNRIGQVTEDPFENRIQDVPMTAICAGLERDLREQLDEHDLPPALEPVDGYLF